jgi:hypothetical protein
VLTCQGHTNPPPPSPLSVFSPLSQNWWIGAGNDEAQGPKKKVVYARKKSSKKPLDAAAAEAEARDAQLEVVRLAVVTLCLSFMQTVDC